MRHNGFIRLAETRFGAQPASYRGWLKLPRDKRPIVYFYE